MSELCTQRVGGGVRFLKTKNTDFFFFFNICNTSSYKYVHKITAEQSLHSVFVLQGSQVAPNGQNVKGTESMNTVNPYANK